MLGLLVRIVTCQSEEQCEKFEALYVSPAWPEIWHTYNMGSVKLVPTSSQQQMQDAALPRAQPWHGAIWAERRFTDRGLPPRPSQEKTGQRLRDPLPGGPRFATPRAFIQRPSDARGCPAPPAGLKGSGTEVRVPPARCGKGRATPGPHSRCLRPSLPGLPSGVRDLLAY